MVDVFTSGSGRASNLPCTWPLRLAFHIGKLPYLIFMSCTSVLKSPLGT